MAFVTGELRSPARTRAFGSTWFLVATALLQLSVLRLSFLQDRNSRIGVFPNGEEVLVSRAGRSRVAAQSVRSPQLQMGQGAGRRGLAYSAMIQDFLELSSRLFPLACLQVSLAANIIGHQA